MRALDFNIKYKDYIEPGFEGQGLEFDNPVITQFLDNIFEDLTKIPGFTYSQIKQKFKSVRFYTNLGVALEQLIENELNRLNKEL